MKETNRPVTSRGYKLILNADRFKNRVEGSQTFWDLVEFLVLKQGGQIHLRQETEKVRRTWYLDTPSLDLRRHHLPMRLCRRGTSSPPHVHADYGLIIFRAARETGAGTSSR